MNNIQMIYGLQRVRQGLPATELSNQALDIAIEHYRMPYTHRNGETLNPTEPGPYWIETTNHFNGVVDFTIDYWMRDGYWALGYHVPQDTDKIYGPIPEPIKVNPHA